MGLFGRKKQPREFHRILVGSDLHGSTRCLKKLFAAGERYQARTFLIAGDLTGKLIIPIVNHNGTYVSHFQGTTIPVSADELSQHLETIESSGFYPYVITPDELDQLEANPERVDQIFHELVLARLRVWMELAEERLAQMDGYCYVIPGNDDFPEIDAILRGGERFKLVDKARIELDDHHELIGLGVSNVTPWHAPRDTPEEDIATDLEALTAALADPTQAIFLIHCPPARTVIDLAPQLDETLRPKGAGGNMIHVGSTAIRAAIERVQPLVSIHGHIHESRGVDHIGRTTCLNPGSEYSEGILRGILVNLTADGLASHMFFSG